ncbi:MAG: aldehyde dehydrogenase family protein [Phycisphaera sp.]|nr:aldehyde dehydrogenase family protein [Phycisphaera sp.]
MTTNLSAGTWIAAPAGRRTFHAWNPATGEPIARSFPISTWEDLDLMADAAMDAARSDGGSEPGRVARCLRIMVDRLDARRDEIAAAAHEETGLPLDTRLSKIEFDRMLGQLRKAADAAEDVSPGSWRQPLIDGETNIRSDRGPLGGAVLCIGPNNFPLAFHGVSGGDFAAAIASGNPVIAKGHPLHPETGRVLAECAHESVIESGLHPATVQYFHHCEPEDGLRLVRDSRIAAVGFTGSREAGMSIKAAADATGTPAYLEMSSVNPVFIAAGALREDTAGSAATWAGSVLMGAGQFCTKPGIVVVIGPQGDTFVEESATVLEAAEPGLLFSSPAVDHLAASVAAAVDAGARLVVGGGPAGSGFGFRPTLLDVPAVGFLEGFTELSAERFGPVGMVVRANDLGEAVAIAERMEGQLTATICTGGDDTDDDAWMALSSVLRPRCGRLLENKMPTGVAVVPSMVHGGPHPATGHPGFTAVGMPTSIVRFTMARCWDGVSERHLPGWLR